MTSPPPYTVAGEGPGVVLLHSGICDARQWDPQWAALSERFRVVRHDRRGYGESPVPEAPYSDLDDLVAVLDAAGVGDVAVVGSSAGGVLALQLALAQPDRVRRLVLLCADADVAEPTEAVLAFVRREDELVELGDLTAATDLNVGMWVGPEADAATRTLVGAMQRRAFELQLAAGENAERMPGPDTDPAALARITAPTLVVSGALDVDYFGHVADGLVAAIPDARRLEIPWAAHLPNLERPDEVTDLLLRELAG